MSSDSTERLPAQSPSSTWTMGTWVGVLAIPLVVVVGAVVLLAASDASGGGQGHTEAASSAEPLDLASVPDLIAVHYESAAAHPDTYRDVPCYCGCEEFLAHRDLYDCFVRADGKGWDSHAAGCGICIAESVMVIDLLDQGFDTPSVREAVVAKFGATTPTVPPAA